LFKDVRKLCAADGAKIVSFTGAFTIEDHTLPLLFRNPLIHRIVMPIRSSQRWFLAYPVDTHTH
jgi:hypothetical protein